MRLSVLIDRYNHERLIETAINSVLEQDFPAPEREEIVVDGGSTDGTAEIVRRYAPQVRLVAKKNGGQASAFNAGIPECRGEVIVFLDGDDRWAPGKLRKLAQVFGEDPALGMIGHAFIESFGDRARKTVAQYFARRVADCQLPNSSRGGFSVRPTCLTWDPGGSVRRGLPPRGGGRPKILNMAQARLRATITF